MHQKNLYQKKFQFLIVLYNSLGDEGWELVDVFEETETVHPNFGNSEYVTGIQPNVRTSEISFVFNVKNNYLYLSFRFL